MERKKEPPSLPGVWATVARGFDLTTHHLWLLVLPVLLDTFFWLGPRLGVRSLLEQSASAMTGDPVFGRLAPLMAELASQVNLFAYLSLPIVGVPTLMGGLSPQATPLRPLVWELDGYLLWFAVVAGFTFGGLLLATLYLGLIARAVANRPWGTAAFARHLLRSFSRFLALAVIFISLLLAICLPLVPLALVASLLSPMLAQAILLSGFVMLATYLAFSLHGILLNDRPVGRALLESVRLVQRFLAPAALLFMVAILVRGLLAAIWRMADVGSWLTFVSIVGYSFVSTALIVSTFLFYQDRFEVLWPSLEARASVS